MKEYSVENLTALIEEAYEIIGTPAGKYITQVKAVTEADEHSLVWLRPDHKSKQQFLETTKAQIVICDHSLKLTTDIQNEKVLIVVENPKLVFVQLVRAIFMKKPIFGIHPTAVIHAEAKIAPDTYIGPLTYIGKAEIEAGTIINGHTYIADNVKIGKNVVIEAGCVIGEEGYNFIRDAQGKLHKFPHLGGVIIEDDVEIQALSVIDRGVLEDTVIGQGTKIDSCCYIAHNCKVGKHNVIIGHTMLSGSVKIGDNCWISPATTFRDGIQVGSESFVGMGSLVVKPLEAKSKVMGAPAKPIEEVKKIQDILKGLLYDKDQ